MSIQWESVFCDCNTAEEYDDIIKNLRRIAPHIKWRTSLRDHDYGPYTVLEVPIENYSEAEFIIEKYEDGEDLSDYSYKDKYPELFIKINGERELRPNILDFYNLSSEYVSLICNFNKLELREFIKITLMLLPKIYSSGLELPNCYAGSSLEEACICHESLDFGKYDSFLEIDPYSKKVSDEYSVSEILESILEDLHDGVSLFEDADPDTLAAIVNDWYISFKMNQGIGTNIIRVLKPLHEIFYKRDY